MAKIKNPFLSLSGFGSINRLLTARRSSGGHHLEQRPYPQDVESAGQVAHRQMWQMITDLWHALSPAEKDTWESNARPRHMTGYAWFMSQALKPNPGIYLPLAGGTMTGNIDMGGNKIQTLPAPGAGTEPARLAELTAHAGEVAGVHGLKGEVSFSVYQTSPQVISIGVLTPINFHATEWDTGPYFNLTTDRYTPLIAGKYQFQMANRIENLANTSSVLFYLRKNGATYAYLTQLTAGATIYHTFNGSRTVPMNGSTDYIELVCYHNQAPTVSTGGTKQRNWFQAHLIAQT